MKVTFITTFFNEERTIGVFLESLVGQTRMPDEIILVDGGSSDKTLAFINSFTFPSRTKVKVITKKGNRSVGRNEAIRKASGDIIACSDVGCILDKNWLKEIVKPFDDKTVDVVAGYYQAKARSLFQKCLVPYALMMPDKVDPDSFLPATRSIAFKKAVWNGVGGFDEKLSHNEDYVFARRIKEKGYKIVFAKDAVVSWIPRSTFKQAFIMFYRFALGDIEARIYRPNVIALFLRYLFAINLLLLIGIFRNTAIVSVAIIFFLAYLIWIIKKNYRYVNDTGAIIMLPLIQFTADIAVLSGSSYGLLKRCFAFIKSIVMHDRKSTVLLILYVVLMLSLITWGLPGPQHPFIYHMDEWHQLAAIRAIVKYGTATVSGAAQIPFFHLTSSIIFLIPFIVLQIVHPLAIKSSFDNQSLATIFIVLRLHTLTMAVLSALMIYKIARDYLKISPFYSLFFFLGTPIFIALTNYYKYDITLLCCLVLFIWMACRFIRESTEVNFVLASIAAALAMSTKFSAIPLIPLLCILFVFFSNKKKKIRTLVLGGVAYLLTFVFFGIPDMFFSKGNYTELLYSNLVQAPSATREFIISMSWEKYLLFYQFPFLFGIIFAVLSALSVLFIIHIFVTKKITFVTEEGKLRIFLLVGLGLILLSLSELKIAATGNRSLVLLPFLALLIGILLNSLKFIVSNHLRFAIIGILCILQIIQVIPFVTIKYAPDPRQTSSLWMLSHLPKHTVIGIQNIPIYQYLPDIALKEFYEQQKKQPTNFRYEVIDSRTGVLPKFIIVSNADIFEKYVRDNPTNSLLQRLQKEHYRKIVEFYPKGFLTNYLPRREFYNANIGPTTPIPSIAIYSR